MPKTDAKQIKAHLAIAKNFYDETYPGMNEFYVMDVGWLWAINAELLAACEMALNLIHAPDAPDSGASPIVVMVRQVLRAAIARAKTWL